MAPGNCRSCWERGDGTFEGTIYPATNRPQAVAGADFNGDGKLDLAVAKDNFGGDNKTLSIMLNNGDGTFAPGVDYVAGTGSYAVVTGDFNHDGKQDVAIPNLNESTISVFLGNGDGTLRGPVDYPVYANPKGLITGDFNNDGKLDLLAFPQGGFTMSLLLGNGDGTFQNHVDIADGNGVSEVKAGDFNGDGKLDLAIVEYGYKVSVWLGNGDGTFQSPRTLTAGNYPCSLAVGDFNGDGKADLAVSIFCDTENSPFNVLLGNGDGTFQTPLQQYDSGMYGNSLVAADFDGDGKLDLAGPGVVPVQGGGSASVVYGNGDGTFQHHVDYGVNLGFVSVTAADLQGSGAMDLVGAALLDGNPLIGEVAVLRNGPQIALRPNRSTFYRQAIGDSSVPQAFLVSSAGVAALKLSSIAAVGDDFSQTNTCPSLLSSGSTCTLTGNFTPTVVGTRTGGVLIHDSAPGGLHGLFFSGLGYAVKLSSGGANFGVVPIGQTGTRQIGLTNRGGIDTSITSIAIHGPNASEFSQTNTCGSTILANSSCTMTISFKPTKKGMKFGVISINDTDASSPQSVVMRGLARER